MNSIRRPLFAAIGRGGIYSARPRITTRSVIPSSCNIISTSTAVTTRKISLAIYQAGPKFRSKLAEPLISSNTNIIACTKRKISLAGWYSKKKRGKGWNTNSKKSETQRRDNENKISIIHVTEKEHDIIKRETINSTPQGKISLKRFFNPWQTLASIIPNEDMLHEKVESTTRTFGIVAALMGSLAAALITFNPYDGYDTNREPVRRDTNYKSASVGRNNNMNKVDSPQNQPFSPLPIKRRKTINFIEHVTFTHHVSGTSLLVSWGIQESQLDDIYTACCAGSFYSGVLTTVLSSVINAWLAATPPGAIRSFVRCHSWGIVALPALLGISTSLAGSALFIALDRQHGTPVSYVGLGGTVIGGLAIGLVTGKGWVHTYKSLTRAVSKSSGK